jgi:hypothetical protein
MACSFTSYSTCVAAAIAALSPACSPPNPTTRSVAATTRLSVPPHSLRQHTESESKPESDFSAEDLRARLLGFGPKSPSPRESPIGFGPRSPSPRASPICFGPRSPSPRASPILAADPEVRVHGRARSGLDPGARVHAEESDLASHLLRPDLLGRALIGPLREAGVLF